MAGGFPAEQPAAGLQFFHHVAVAHLGAHEPDTVAGKALLERVVRHEGTCRPFDLAFTLSVAHDDVKQFVSVVETPFGIRHDESVGVPVKCETVVAPRLSGANREVVRVRGAHTVIDVETVGIDGVRHHIRPQFMKDRGRDVVSRPVGAVKVQFQPAQIRALREGALAKFNVAAFGVVQPPRLAESFTRFAEKSLINFRFNLKFHCVRQLRALRREEFDAVVAEGVVTRADDDARRQTQRPREVRHRGRRNRPAENDVDACGGKPCLQRGFEHIARHPRVFADQHRRPSVRTRAAQYPARGLAQQHDKVRSHWEGSHRSTHPVGAEITS